MNVYQVNEMIMYGTDGVCKIDSIVTKEIGGNSIEYYVLKPVYSNNSTIYVPVHNPHLKKKMHQVLTSGEIYQLIKAMPDENVVWIENENERKEKFKEIIMSGDRMSLIKMIKALYFHQQKQQEKGKRLRASDERFFTEAERILYDEFALVLNIEPEPVLPFIMEQVQISEKNQTA